VSTDAASIAAAVAPAVVSIRTRPARLADLFASTSAPGEGTGIVIRSDGMIVTDASLIESVRTITVTFGDGRSLPARVVGRDASSGIAVLKVAISGLPTARLAKPSRLRVGDDVVALGDALALPGGPTVSRGVVAALHRTVTLATSPTRVGPARLTDLVEVTNALGAANAGGPVVNTDGEVVGIATIVANGSQPPGFAIDIARAGPVIRALEAGRAPSGPLGVDAIDVTPGLARRYGLPVESGALVAAVVPGSAADTAGLRPDDIVVRVGHLRVATAEDLARGARDASLTSLQLSILRGRKSLTLTVPLVH
jgi:S1-C subfamily serine protease